MCFMIFDCRMLPFIVGNVGMVFTKGDLIDCREILLQNKVGCCGYGYH